MGELHIIPESEDDRLLLMGFDRPEEGYTIWKAGSMYESSQHGCGLLRIGLKGVPKKKTFLQKLHIRQGHR